MADGQSPMAVLGQDFPLSAISSFTLDSGSFQSIKGFSDLSFASIKHFGQFFSRNLMVLLNDVQDFFHELWITLDRLWIALDHRWNTLFPNNNPKVFFLMILRCFQTFRFT